MKEGLIIRKKLVTDYWADKITSREYLLLGEKKETPELSEERIMFSGSIVAQVNALARGNEKAASVIFLSVFALLLKRYFTCEALIISMPVPDGAGLNVNAAGIMPLALAFAGDKNFKEALQHTREALQEGIKYLPDLELTVADYLEKKGVNDHAMYQFGFADDQIFSDVTCLQTVHFQCYIERSQAGEESVRFRYNNQLLECWWVKQFACHYRQLLQALPTYLNTPVDQVPLLSQEELRELTEVWNNTAADYPATATLHGLFEQRAAEQPDAVAVVFDDKQWTYREVNEWANRLAHYLIGECKLQIQEPVGLVLDRSEWMIIAILGILKAGGAYTPIDPSYPTERINYTLTNAGIRVLLKEAGVQIAPDGMHVLSISALADKLAEKPATNPCLPMQPDHLAYIIYTSGSTGSPKGVMIEHRGAVNRVDWMWKAYGFEATDVIFQKTPYVFDVSVWEFFLALCYGARLVLCRKEVVYDPKAITSLIAQQGITTLHFVPTMFQAFLESLTPDMLLRLASLRRVFTSGEALLPHTVRNYYEYLSAPLHNLYGPTEASVDVSYYATQSTDRVIPIGKPISNMQLYVLDRYQCPVPIGVAGEICIGGIGLARGYINNANLTEEKFVPHPFKARERVYLTGDLGRFLPDGNIEFIGRKDFQVKIRGFRIELGEIESALLQHPQVDSAVALAINQGEQLQLVAFVISAEVTQRELAGFLARSLPEYMIPAQIIPVKQFPFTATGKIDRKALGSLLSAATATEEHIAPQTGRQQLLAHVWTDVLGKTPIGINDNFFHLGGDSISAIQIASRVARQHYRLEVKDVFQAPVLKDMALRLVKRMQVIDQSTVEGEVKLTPIQREFFETVTLSPHHYNQTIVLSTNKRLSVPLLQEMLAILLAHHDALRLSFKREAGVIKAWNEALSTHKPTVATFDFSAYAAPEAAQLLEENAAQLQQSLQLDKVPLVRWALFRMPDGDRFVMIVHHLVIDGVSWRILLEDIGLMMAQATQELPLQLPLKTHSFQTWAKSLAEYANTASMLRQIPYWKQVAEQYAALPARLPQEQDTEKEMPDPAVETVVLSIAATEQLLGEVHKAYSTQINDVLLSAVGAGVGQWSGQTQIGILLEGHGREPIFSEMDLSRTVGWFTSLYPVVLTIPQESSVRELIRHTKETLHQVPHKGVGYGILQYLTRPEHTQDIPFRQEHILIFNYLGKIDAAVSTTDFRLAVESAGPVRDVRTTGRYALEFSAVVVDQQLRLSFGYDRRRFKASAMQELSAKLNQHLHQIIEHCLHTAAPELTPSDCTWSELTLAQWDKLVASYDVQDVYRLLPMQEGMLFQALYQPESTAYFEQLSFRLQGSLEVPLVQACMQDLAQRHEALRTVFVYEQTDYPLQVVLQNQVIPVQYEEVDSASCLESYKQNDRNTPFDLSRGPLMRLSIVKLREQVYELIWSHHHILMDGWCISFLVGEFFNLYQQKLGLDTPPLPPVYPYKNYIKWLEQVDQTAADQFWRSYLTGYETIATLKQHNLPLSPDPLFKAQTVKRSFTVEQTQQLGQLASSHQVTLTSWLQTLWAALLGQYTQNEEVVFGSVVSGRPSSLEGVEGMIGLFINTIPVRIRVHGQVPVAQLVKAVQQQAIEAEPYHYYPLADIQAASASGHPLFDHIMVVENYPVAKEVAVGSQQAKDLFQLTAVESVEQTSYDLTLLVTTNPSLEVLFRFNANTYDPAWIDQVAAGFADLVQQVINNASVTPPQLFVNQLTTLASSRPDHPAKHVSAYSGRASSRTLPLTGEEHSGQEWPMTENEKKLAAIWSHLLGYPAVSRTDHFFEKGGHSIKAIRLVSAIFREWGLKLSIEKIFQNPQLWQQATLLEADHPDTFQAISPLPEQPTYSSSYAQRRLWILQQLDASKVAYNMVQAFVLRSSLRVEALQKAFEQLVQRQESLRTTFRLADDQLVQVIHPAAPPFTSITFEDTSSCVDPEGAASALIMKTQARVFDLEQGPLAAIHLIKLGEDKHVCVLGMHHSIGDAWSMQVLFDEWLQLYQSVLSDVFPALPLLSVQYKDYAGWQQQWLSSAQSSLAQAYWTQQLSGELPVLQLPLDFPRPAVKTYNGATRQVLLDTEVSKRLSQLVASEGASVFMGLLSSVYALLYRYTYQEDIILGTPIAGRDLPGLDHLIGCFLNTLALRQTVKPDDTFRELLARVKKTALDAFTHQWYPFDKLVDDLQLARDVSRSPVFDVMVILQEEAKLEQLTGAQPLIVEPFATATTISKFDLTFHFTRLGEDTGLLLEYNTDLFAESSMDHLLERYQVLLGNLLTHADTPIKQASYLSEREYRKLFVDYAAPALPYPAQSTIHQLLEEQLLPFKHQKALFYEDRALSYLDLHTWANRLAHLLKEQFGIKPDDRVGLLMDRSDWMVISMVGVLKSGGAYVPIDPIYPADRIRFMLTDADVNVLLTSTRRHLDLLPADYPAENAAKIICLDEYQETLSQYPDTPPITLTTGHHLAYMIYTSGSTGVPKAVMIRHANAVSFLAWCREEFRQTHYQTVLAATSYCFDLSVFEIFFSLYVGKTIRVLNSPLELMHYMEQQEATLINTVPSVVSQLLQEGASWQNVRAVNMAGEPIPITIKEQLDYHRMEVRNLYGPSEDTTYSTSYRFSDDHQIIPIGRPIANTRCYLLDEYQQPVGQGLVGEIYLGGAGIAKGYWQRPELTSDRFVSDPFVAGEVMYKTGDLGRWLPDGQLQYLGRKDGQIKLRGYRIELGEIESCLEKHPLVQQAVATVHQSADSEAWLVAYLVTHQPLEDAQLVAYLRQQLPGYMIPAQWVHLPALPLNANGKLDRKALPRPELPAQVSQRAIKAPAGVVEKSLVAIWQEVLNRENVGVEDNFFLIGGNSLKLIKLFNSIHKAYPDAIKITDLFTHTTIAEQAAAITKAEHPAAVEHNLIIELDF